MSYQEKYLKYKKKYIDLKQNLFQINGGGVCPIIGFHQHKGECWHDALSTILLFNDGISENVQELFDKGDISELETYGIPIDLLPLNFNLENPLEQEKLFDIAVSYINESYNRYTNDKQPITAGPITAGPITLMRQDSLQFSLECVKGIFNIVNHNRLQEVVYADTKHSGKNIHDIITLNIFSYFLLNKPNTRPYFLSSNTFYLSEIFNVYNSIETIISILLKMCEYLKDSLCILIKTNKQPNGVEDYREDEEEIITETINGHVQCFFKCGGVEKYYDDNKVNRYISSKLYINFEWKKYLNEIITEIITEIIKKKLKKEDIPKFYCKFSKLYFNPLYNINYNMKNKSRIYGFTFVRKILFNPESYKNNLLENLPAYMWNYNNEKLINLIKTNDIDNIDDIIIFHSILTGLQNNSNNILKTLLEKPYSQKYFMIQNKDGLTLLMFAITKNNMEIVQLLLTKKSIEKSFTIQDKNGYTPLIWAITQNNMEIVQLLLTKKSIEKSFTIQNNDGNTPLLVAIKIKNIDIIKLLLTIPIIKDSITIQNNDGNTPLLVAIKKNNIKIIKLLLKIPGIEDSFIYQNNDGNTPLLVAIKNNNIEIIKLLLKIPGIEYSFTIQNNDSDTPLLVAIKNNNIEIIKLLLTIPGIENSFIMQTMYGYISLLSMAIKDNKIEIINELLKNPIINKSFIIPDNDGNTPLLVAIINNNTEIIKSLLRIPGIETSFTIQNNDGNTPLLVAIINNNTEIIKSLLRIHGIETSFTIQNNAGETPNSIGNLSTQP